MSDAAKPSFLATYRRLLGYLWPSRRVVAFALFGMTLDAACSALFADSIQKIVDQVFTEHDEFWVFWMPFFIIAIFAVRGIGTYLTDYGMARVARGIVHRLRNEVFARYLDLSAAHFASETSGHMVSRLTFTVEQVASACTDSLKILILHSLTVIGYVVVMLTKSVRLTAALFVLAPIIALIVSTVSKRYRRIAPRIQHSMGEVTGTVDEVVSAQREVKIYGGQAYERERFDRVANENRRLNLKIAATNALSTSTVQIVAAFAIAAVIFVATRPGIIKHITAGEFMSIIVAMSVMLTSIKQLTTVQANMQRGIVAAEDLFGVLDAPGERDTGTQPLALCRGEIGLRGVSLRYAGQHADALDGVDLHCAPGTVTALVGRSGSGKSSLVALVPRFHEPTSGEIRLDGTPLADYRLADLRAQIAWVGQHVVLFNDTIARNIAYGALADASREAIEAAARAANAMEFIERLPLGLDSPVGEGGAQLSGGQRQRIAIARAILKDAPILILDEATSALDTESERLIQDALGRLMARRTVLVIAHRLSTIEHADRIAVLDEGRIVERGTHAELIARNGRYAALHRLQFHESSAAAAQESSP
ncbi:MAG: lipid A export permease/ATP-binding protein MsbA [Rudaea sp.]|uniref:lipid A export permease/ATP-binding protein MsbA n=1 Tax=Rudaea sp. TaxID=2136325 RepID=UPI0039E6A907